MKNDRLPTVFEVRCNCGHIHTIRTKEPNHTVKCWQAGCETTIRVVLGAGRNNYSIYLKQGGNREVRTHPVSVIQ
jgi:hypothetical protein